MKDDIPTSEYVKAARRGVQHALKEHALWGQSVSIWRDGKIVKLSPEEIFAELRRQEQETNDTTDER